MTRDDCLSLVRELVREHVEPTSDTDPLDLESLSVVLLVEAIEDRLGVAIAAHEVTPARFETVAALAEFVQGKLA